MPKYLIEFIFMFFVIIFTLLLVITKSDLDEFIPLVATFTVASLKLFQYQIHFCQIL